MSGGRLPHGYTNETARAGCGVRKTYTGFDAPQRAAVERACLRALHGVLPVPAVLDSDARGVVTEFLPGQHGQELIESGRGPAVMRAAGALLRALDAVPAHLLRGLPGDGPVLVHGDFGPQNLLFDAEDGVTAVLDWEFAHRGRRVEDLAWAEWIVRMHHPGHRDVIAELFAGYGRRPPWPLRQHAMLSRCEDLMNRCVRNGLPEAASMWADRLSATKVWEEMPAASS